MAKGDEKAHRWLMTASPPDGNICLSYDEIGGYQGAALLQQALIDSDRGCMVLIAAVIERNPRAGIHKDLTRDITGSPL